MPKNFEFVGFRKYDPLALSGGQQTYTEGIDYYGGDTQVYLTDLSVTTPTPFRINCLRSLTGGGLFNDMIDTSCHGQLHRSWMQGRADSDPIQTTISAMSELAVDLVFKAYRTKRTIQMMILYPDSRYIEGLVRVERIDFNATIDTVFEYLVTFRRAHTPEFGKGVFTLDYDLKGGTWKDSFKPDTMPYYTKDTEVSVPNSLKDYVKPPINGYVVDSFTAYNRVTGDEVPITNEKFTITGHTVIQVKYKPGSVGVTLAAGNPAEAQAAKNQNQNIIPGQLRAAFPETDERYPIGTVITLPARPNLAIDKHWELVGWTIDGKSYEFGGQYQIMAETVVEGRWQEMTIMEFAAGDNSSGVAPEPIRVEKGKQVTVPSLATDPEGHYRAVGWRDEARHVTYTPGQKVELTRDMTLTATWKQLHYVKYSVDRADVEEGTIPVDQTAYEAGNHITMPELAYITKEGFTFAGWERGSGDTHIYQPGEHYAVKPTDGEEIIFDAKWEEET